MREARTGAEFAEVVHCSGVCVNEGYGEASVLQRCLGAGTAKTVGSPSLLAVWPTRTKALGQCTEENGHPRDDTQPLCHPLHIQKSHARNR